MLIPTAPIDEATHTTSEPASREADSSCRHASGQIDIEQMNLSIDANPRTVGTKHHRSVVGLLLPEMRSVIEPATR